MATWLTYGHPEHAREPERGADVHVGTLPLRAPVAQGIEQWFPKPRVGCSNHPGGTTICDTSCLCVPEIPDGCMLESAAAQCNSWSFVNLVCLFCYVRAAGMLAVLVVGLLRSRSGSAICPSI